ncbi:hypothetical protein ACJX0J_034363, partial [Zea mays]
LKETLARLIPYIDLLELAFKKTYILEAVGFILLGSNQQEYKCFVGFGYALEFASLLHLVATFFWHVSALQFGALFLAVELEIWNASILKDLNYRAIIWQSVGNPS